MTLKEDVKIKTDSVEIYGILSIPEDAKGLVLFVHGSGSSRFSKRNNFVAEVLQKHGFATLLFDLLTEEEDLVYETRFDIKLLDDRLMAATEWVKNNERIKNLPIGYFGSSTGAASAINAAAMLDSQISAVVSRGGRPDMAEDKNLAKIEAPTILIVGGNDDVVIELNEKAYKKLTGIKEMKIIPGATHLFEEPGTLEEVSRVAAEWFEKYLI